MIWNAKLSGRDRDRTDDPYRVKGATDDYLVDSSSLFLHGFVALYGVFGMVCPPERHPTEHHQNEKRRTVLLLQDDFKMSPEGGLK